LAAIDPVSRRRGLLVEVHPELGATVPPSVRREFCGRLFSRNIRVGMLVTPQVTLVIRDRLRTMQFRDDEYEVTELPTRSLLDAANLGPARTDEELSEQFANYLFAVAASWSTFVPDEAIPAFIPEVVAEVAQANIETWDGALERDDAR
jgi:hypothetical protein